MPATFFPGALCCPPGPVEGKAGPSQKTAEKQGTKNHQKTIKSLSPPTLWSPIFVVLKGVAYNMLSKNLEGRFDLSPILDFGSLERPGPNVSAKEGQTSTCHKYSQASGSY